MKVLIWVLCAFVYSLIMTALSFNGLFFGGIPAIVLGCITFAAARFFCKQYDLSKENSSQDSSSESPSLPSDSAPELSPLPEVENPQPAIERWYTCPKCGQLVRDGEECDCEERREAEERRKALERAKTIQRKSQIRRALPFAALCLALALISGTFRYKVYELQNTVATLQSKLDSALTENHSLQGQNKTLQRENKALQSESSKFESSAENLQDMYIDLLLKYSLLSSSVGFIVEDGTKLYHRNDSQCISNYESCWIYNTESCESFGYSACPKCWNIESLSGIDALREIGKRPTNALRTGTNQN